MMLRQLQGKLDSSWIQENNILDVVVYGSYSRGNVSAKDIDIAIILKEPASVNTKMSLAQQFRHRASHERHEHERHEHDVVAVDINDLSDPGFLARESILAEGHSLLRSKSVAEIFGFKPLVIIQYNLKRLTASKKKMFYYALQGRKRGTGILKKLQGRILSKGILEIPTEHYEEMKTLMNHNRVPHTSTFVLMYRVR